MDLHTIILFLCISSAVAGFAIGRLSQSQSKKRITQFPDKSEERVCFFKFTQLVLDLLPILLRQYFKERWHATYGRAWKDTRADGDVFYHGTFETHPSITVNVQEGNNVALGKLAGVVQRPDGSPGLAAGDQILLGNDLQKVMLVKKNALHLSRHSSSTGLKEVRTQLIRGERNMDSRMQRHFEPKILLGDTRDWDISLLCFALLYSSHGLIPIGDDARQLVQNLRDLRNDKLAHVDRCSMPREELLDALHQMDMFIEYCLPSEWEVWLGASREILDADPRDFEDGQTGGYQHDSEEGCEYVSIAVDQQEGDFESGEFHALMDRISTRHHHHRFMDEAKARWLNELSGLAISSPFSIASVKFT